MQLQADARSYALALDATEPPFADMRVLAEALGAIAADPASCHDGTAPFAMATAMAVLWARLQKFDAADPRWPDRDRFVLAHAGAAPLLRGLLCLTGHQGVASPGTESTRADVPFAVEYGVHPAIEASAAPGGHTVAMAVGLAIAERAMAARFGRSLVDHRVWVLATAADLSQGVTLEAIGLAGQLRLERLVVLADATCGDPDDMRGVFASFGWAVKSSDSAACDQVEAALSFALRSRKPTLVWCTATTSSGAGAGAGADRTGAPSPAAIDGWRQVGLRGSSARRGWLKRIARHPQRAEFERAIAGRLPEGWHEAMSGLKLTLRADAALSPADACQQMVERLVVCLPELLHGRMGVGSASTGTPTGQAAQTMFGGRCVSYGNRPLALAACANGVALHDGLLPMIASDWADIGAQLPSLRLAALQRRRTIVLAFDPGSGSVTWRPSDLLCGLRSIPHLHVFRPACAVEVAECLELAIRRADGPSLLVLTQAVLPALRTDTVENRCGRGGYVLAEADGPRRATLIAAGAELALAVEARARLAADGVAVAVVSLPCWALFAAQAADYRRGVLGGVARIGIEAAPRTAWDQLLGENGSFIDPRGGGPGGIDAIIREVRAVA